VTSAAACGLWNCDATQTLNSRGVFRAGAGRMLTWAVVSLSERRVATASRTAPLSPQDSA
jgi:hypothetical protein